VSIVPPALPSVTFSVAPAGSFLGNVGLSATSLPVSLRVTNDGQGSQNLTITNITNSGTDAALFNVTSSACLTTLLPTGFCDILATFRPTTIGAKSTSITVTSSAGQVTSLPLTGAGVSSLSVAPSPVSFGNVAVSSVTTPITLAVSNNGAGGSPLTVNSISLTGADSAMFQVNNGTCTLPVTLDPGASCNFAVSFNPTSSALKNASANISASSSLALQGEPADLSSVAMSGRGVTAFAPVQMTQPAQNSYATITQAFAAATGNTTLRAWGTVLPAATGVTVNSSGTVSFNGGYDALFATITPGMMTAMQGLLTIRQGTLVVDGLIIQ
jgi:hypothetical protein